MRIYTVLRFCVAILLAVVSLLFFALAPVQAQQTAVELPAIVVDANNGKVLFANRADEVRAPASITKVMTLYLVFDALQSGRINWNTQMPVSKNAASRPRMKLGAPAGSTLSVREAVNALVVVSANDAAVVVAEYLAGSEERFAQVMTLKARSLGMRNTTFKNANGLPASGHVSTARDIALMSIAMREHFPQYYNLFSQRQFSYRGQVFKGHNRVLDRIDGADGLKTGFTNLAGFTITTTVAKNGKKIVVVVLGGKSTRQRDDLVVLLANAYFDQASRFGKKRLFSSWTVAQSVWRGQPAPKTVVVPQGDVVTASVNTPRAAAPAAITPTRKPASAPTAMAYADTGAKTVEDVLRNQLAGNFVVQVAALPDAQSANSFLKNIKQALGDAKVASLAYVEPATVDAKQVYRVRLGSFTDQAAAVDVCNAIKAQAYSCFVTAN
ncbi:SPOR domain-containing protein [Bartonella sp. LJL80]